MKRISLIILLAILVFLPLLSQAAGLVPCGGKGEPACQLCHFFVMFQKVTDFLLKYILLPLAALMLMIGGFMYVFAYLNPSEALFGRKGGPALISQAKRLIISVIIGLIVLFLAWGIVNAMFQMLGAADWTGLKAGHWWTGNWWNVNQDCPTESSPLSACTPATCDSLGKQCGIWYDNCGKYLTCPACPSGQTCNTLGQCISLGNNGNGGNASSSGNGNGQYSQQVAAAVKLDQPCQPTPQSYGLFVFPVGAYTIPQGATVYFLIDPSSFDIQVPSNLVIFNLGDYAQGGNGILNAYVYELDSSNNLWTGSHAPPSNPFQINLPNNNGGFSEHYYQPGKKYLIKVQEMGVKATPFNIWWNAD